MSLFVILYSLLAGTSVLAGAPVVAVGTQGEFYFRSKKTLSCDSFQGKSVIWKSETSKVSSAPGDYECQLIRAADREHQQDCDKIPDTALSSGPSESRKFRVADVRKNYFILDFSQKPNALFLNCKALNDKTDPRKHTADELKQILSNFETQVKSIEAKEPVTDKVKHDEALPKSPPIAI